MSAPSFQQEAQERVVAEWRVKAQVLGRAVKEWIGKTPDSVPPPRVRLRILLTWDRKCYLTGQPIRPGAEWDQEHVISLNAGGENREGNIRPAIKAPHKLKSKQERAEAAKVADIAKSHYGIEPESKRKIPRPPKRAKPPRDKLPLPPITHVCGVPVK